MRQHVCTLIDKVDGSLLMSLTARQTEFLVDSGMIFNDRDDHSFYLLEGEATVEDCRTLLAAYRPSNKDFAADLMTFSKSGPLMEVFVIQALDQFSKAVTIAGPSRCDSSLINPAAWHACAVELQDKLKERLK